MFRKISNYYHILKARAVVAYVLFYTIQHCLGVHFKHYFLNIRSRIRHPVRYFNGGFPEIKKELKEQCRLMKEGYDSLYRDFFKNYIAHRKTPLADYVYIIIECTTLSNYFSRIIGVAWFCEKMGLNLKITFSNTYIVNPTNFFENTILSYASTCHPENFTRLKKPLVSLNYRNNGIFPSLWEAFGKRRISNEYGHKIISTLSIKQELRQQAAQWYRANIKGTPCVGVHYRRTDVFYYCHIIKIEDYIDYLKQVLDDRCMIYACSDTAQFIEAIHKEFPGRVASRDIVRSTGLESLHRHAPYAGEQQQKDALIDLLILAKTETIYTVGSQFIDMIRYFNPSVKIISLDERGEGWYHGLFPNFIPIPKRHLVKEAQADIAWKDALSDQAKELSDSVEHKKNKVPLA